jgi:ribosome-associated heat shock protein Hsp15
MTVKTQPHQPSAADGVRLDKWLWAARFFKTRSLASDEIGKNRVQVNGKVAKASRDVRVGDRIELRQGLAPRTVVVLGLSVLRGSASLAGQLFEETPESVAQREQIAAQRRLAPEPAQSQEQGRPTKRDRRLLSDWNRWSASIDPNE